MCGIIGYIGDQDAKEILLDSLQRLEYRGYDSAGIAVLANGRMSVEKEVGRIANLRSHVEEKLASTACTMGI